MLQKPGGGERPLGIPTIGDRVAKAAAKLVLEPIWEAELEPNAYGYRPRRSAQDAIQKVDELLHEGYRAKANGYRGRGFVEVLRYSASSTGPRALALSPC